MYRGVIASEGDVSRDFVDLPTNGDLARVGAGIGHEGQPVLTGHHRIGNDPTIVEERLDDRRARTGYGPVSLAITGMKRAALWKSVRHQVGPVTLENSPRLLFTCQVSTSGYSR